MSTKIPASIDTNEKTGLGKFFDSVSARVDNQINRFPTLVYVISKTPWSTSYVAKCFIICVAIILVIGFPYISVTNTIGFLYPAYESFKAIEQNGDLTNDVHWLTYWVVFAFTMVLESFTEWFIDKIPFYSLFKMAFLLFLFWDYTQGATLIYKKCIRPLLLQNQAQIDQELEKLPDVSKTAAEISASLKLSMVSKECIALLFQAKRENNRLKAD
jgi:receptor expression-enhancing protein 5/6